MVEPLIFEKSRAGRRGYIFPADDVPSSVGALPDRFRRSRPPKLPEVSEIDVVRHFVRLSRANYGIDVGFYPLGSCTMKYNQKINEELARAPEWTGLHPLQPVEHIQGALRLMAELEHALCAITGMSRAALQPAAGAQGELAGLLIVRAYHRAKQLGTKQSDARPSAQAAPAPHRTVVLIPDSAHGTNPASATLAGYEVEVVKSTAEGLVDLDDLRRKATDRCAAMMLTQPNTLGLFERDILEIARIVHDAGGLMYMDGANLNALLGLARPGDMGFDVVHINLHKTFSTPHGGGGPGAGPVAVTSELAPYLPGPLVSEQGGRFALTDGGPLSIGRLHAFYGNFGILLRAAAYMRTLGAEGMAAVSRTSILNANYVRRRLASHYQVAYDRTCMHEVVLSAKRQKTRDVHAWDIAKRLIDFGIYPPTVNFPLVVEEAIMIEPVETESKETLDRFCDAMFAIADEAEKEPEKVQRAPHTTDLGRLDEVLAARKPNLRWLPPA
jgi:glycine dehydrogenase subunit 2